MQLTERLEEVRSADGEDLDVYARSVVEHTADAMAHDIGWLDRLIEAERTAMTNDPGPPARTGAL
jgi:hypothetical protein